MKKLSIFLGLIYAAIVFGVAAPGPPAILIVKDPWFDVRAYGTIIDGSTEDATAVQLAIDAAEAKGGGIVFFPKGTYKISTGLTVENSDVSLYFVPGAVLDWNGSATGTVITVGTGSIQYRNNIENLRITHTTIMTGGKALYYNTINTFDISNIQITGAFNAFTLHDGGAGVLRNIQFVNTPISGGTVVLLDNVSDFVMENGTSQGAIGAQPTNGIRVTKTAGFVHLSKLDFFQQGVGLYLNPTTPNAIDQLFVHRCHFEGGTDGILADGSGFVNWLSLLDCGVASNTNHGLSIEVDNLHVAKIIGLMSYLNGLSGVNLEKGAGTFDDVLVNGCTITGNSETVADAEAGILVTGGTSNFRIIGNKSGQIPGLGGTSPNQQSYGLEIEAGAGANFVISDNDFATNVTAGMLNSATGTNQLIGDNINGIDLILAIDNTGTPSVTTRRKTYKTGGTTAITDFDDGVENQVFTLIAEHSLDITDGTHILLSGSANWSMTATDTLTLICKADNKWYEVSRSDSGA
jgi:hypothetical protein